MKNGFVCSTGTVVNCESPWTLRLRGGTWSRGYRTSTSEWRSLLAQAKNGDPEAEWGIADRYADGCKDRRGKIIVRRSATKAAQWFWRAAEHGSAAAQNTLGVMLSNGDGVRKNVDQALFWLKKAYRSGNSCAAQNIAITYRENGDLKAAVKWFRNAALRLPARAMATRWLNLGFTTTGEKVSGRMLWQLLIASGGQLFQKIFVGSEEMTPSSFWELPIAKVEA